MEPVVYDFAINERGTFAELLEGPSALMPSGYYTLLAPALLRQERHSLSSLRRAELDKLARPVVPSPSCAGWCRHSLTLCCRAAKENQPMNNRSMRFWNNTASIGCNTSKSGPI